MKLNSLLLATTLGCGILAADSALAAVVFINARSVSGSSATAWNGLRPSPTTNSNTTTRFTTTESVVTSGLVATHTVNATSGTGDKAAISSDTETTLVQLLGAGMTAMDFTGSTSVTFGSQVGAGAFGTAGDNGSSASYRFRLTTAGHVTISFDNAGVNESPFAYEVVLSDPINSIIYGDYFVGSSLDGTMGSDTFSVPKGVYQVGIIESPGPFAPDYIFATPPGSNVAGWSYGNFVVTVPETATWVMMLAGFAGLGLAGASKKRSAAQAA